MSELAKQIIQQQWENRHHSDPVMRRHAISLIKAHIVLLRQWKSGKEIREPKSSQAA